MVAIVGFGAALVASSPMSSSAQHAAGRAPRAPTMSGDDFRFARGAGAPLTWNPWWSEFGVGHYVLGLSAISVAVLATTAGANEGSPRRGGALIDDDVRRALRAPSPGERQVARDSSDVLLAFNTSYPILVDSLIVSAWYRESPDVATELALIAAETYAVTLAIQTTTNVLASRERPYGERCGTGLDDETNDCVANNRYRSFFSGHTSLSFAAASLTCVNHAKLSIHGGGAADAAVCASGLALASATGALRIVADQHYFTDVLTGAIVGTTTGLVVPLALHYHGDSTVPADGARSGFSFHVVPTAGGVSALGTF